MITPLDIENKKFQKQMMNGYNVEEVDEFLDQILVDYEKNYKDLSTQNAKIEELTNSLNHYKNIETTLQNTLVMAQTTAEEVLLQGITKAEQQQFMNTAEKMLKNLELYNKQLERKEHKKS